MTHDCRKCLVQLGFKSGEHDVTGQQKHWLRRSQRVALKCQKFHRGADRMQTCCRVRERKYTGWHVRTVKLPVGLVPTVLAAGELCWGRITEHPNLSQQEVFTISLGHPVGERERNVMTFLPFKIIVSVSELREDKNRGLIYFPFWGVRALYTSIGRWATTRMGSLAPPAAASGFAVTSHFTL